VSPARLFNERTARRAASRRTLCHCITCSMDGALASLDGAEAAGARASRSSDDGRTLTSSMSATKEAPTALALEALRSRLAAMAVHSCTVAPW
jgi:hypothetical protein